MILRAETGPARYVSPGLDAFLYSYLSVLSCLCHRRGIEWTYAAIPVRFSPALRDNFGICFQSSWVPGGSSSFDAPAFVFWQNLFLDTELDSLVVAQGCSLEHVPITCQRRNTGVAIVRLIIDPAVPCAMVNFWGTVASVNTYTFHLYTNNE